MSLPDFRMGPADLAFKSICGPLAQFLEASFGSAESYPNPFSDITKDAAMNLDALSAGLHFMGLTGLQMMGKNGCFF